MVYNNINQYWLIFAFGDGFMKKILSAVLSVLVLFALCSCTHTESGSSENNENSTNEITTENNEISINEITTVDDFECQIKEVNWYSPSDFDFDVIEREEGFEYLVIVLSEKNTTAETQNAPITSMLSADGKQCVNLTALSLYKKKYKINFGATLPNSIAEAYVIYKVPAGANSFKLQILSNGFGSASEYIVFSRTDIK